MIRLWDVYYYGEMGTLITEKGNETLTTGEEIQCFGNSDPPFSYSSCKYLVSKFFIFWGLYIYIYIVWGLVEICCFGLLYR